MVSADFSPADIILKVQVSYIYCSAIVGEDIPITGGTVGTSAITIADNDQAMAIALLAQAILLEARRAQRTRDNPNMVIRTTPQLFTDEMSNMLLVADETDEADVSENVMWSNDLPTSSWDLGSNGGGQL